MRIDLHVHTRWSADAISRPEWIMRFAKKKGLAGVAVTDHNSTKAWPLMKEAARKHGLLLILGEEIKTYRNGSYSGELLGYFLNEEVRPGTPEEVLDRLEEQDAVISVSHPFDRLKGFRDPDSIEGRVDAIEALNSRVVSRATNDLALLHARSRGLGLTGGSDSHVPWEVGRAYTTADASGLEEFRKALEKRKTGVSGSLSFPIIHVYGLLGHFKQW